MKFLRWFLTYLRSWPHTKCEAQAYNRQVIGLFGSIAALWVKQCHLVCAYRTDGSRDYTGVNGLLNPQHSETHPKASISLLCVHVARNTNLLNIFSYLIIMKYHFLKIFPTYWNDNIFWRIYGLPFSYLLGTLIPIYTLLLCCMPLFF